MSNNAPFLQPLSPPQKNLPNLCLRFIFRRMQYSGEIGKNDYAKFWEVNEVLYGLCESGDLTHERETTRWSEKLSID